MVDLKEAIRRSREFAEDVLGPNLEHILVEGVESSEAEWQIILGFDPRVESAGVALTLGDTNKREYKRFDVDKQTGQVKGVRIQTVD